jgi:hypothetical protein
MGLFTRLTLGLTVLTSLSTACAPAGDEEVEGDQAEVNEANGPRLCAAVRGNGQSIVTHFASLARITEHYGVVEGIAGGSSGSITSFAYESILKNDAVSTCGTNKCTAPERAARVALALKSVQGYGETLVSAEEGVAIGNLVSVIGRIKKETEARGIAALVSLDSLRAARALIEVLEIPEVRSIVNPEVFKMLRDIPRIAFNVREIHTAIATLGAFSVDDNRLFFRTGILDWDALATLFGRVADFYAGYAPAEPKAMGDWLDACAGPTAGKPWEDAAKVKTSSGGTCGGRFTELAKDYRAKVKAGNVQSRRLGEKVGAPGPLHKLVTTAVLEGPAIAAWKKARTAYVSGDHKAGDVPFDIKFGDVKFGYWGSKEDLDKVASGSARGSDAKSKKMSRLGDVTWKEALTASPAEPGLSRFVELSDGRISAGGWSDLAPTLVLDALGCERTIYVTREGDESGFAAKIAKELGMAEADWKALYDLGSPKSAYNVSLERASAVWCTNWNAFGDAQQREMSMDAWKAPLEIREKFSGIEALKPYQNTTERTGKPGCTPGISGGAKFPTQ